MTHQPGFYAKQYVGFLSSSGYIQFSLNLHRMGKTHDAITSLAGIT